MVTASPPPDNYSAILANLMAAESRQTNAENRVSSTRRTAPT